MSQNQWIQPPANWSPSELLGASYIGFDNSPTARSLVDSDPSSWLFAGTGLAEGQAIPSVLSNDFQAYQRSAPNPPNVEILSHSPVQVELHGESFADTTYYTMASSEAGVFQSGTTEWIPSLAPCVPTQVDCPATSLAKLTDNLLRVFGQGPVGLRHPSVADWQQFYP